MIKEKAKKVLQAFMMFIFIFLITATLQKTEVQAAGNYYLQVNKGTNVVTVFKSDGTPYKAFICSTGTATPIGTFNTSQKLRWHTLDGPTYGQYCTRITRGFLFHSVWYYQNGNLASQSYREYNRLGTTASHGCVRLTVADAKWIYDNCPVGVKVSIIYGSAANDPLGKPESIKVNSGQSTGWDPTDPAAGNPYAYLFPSITTSNKSTNVEYGSSFNALANIVARDSLGNDISGRLSFSGKVNTKKLGAYNIDYYVTDALGRASSATVTFNVVDTKKATITGISKKLTKEYNSTIKLKKGVKARTADKKNLTNKIKVKIIYPGTKKERTYTKSNLKLKKLGTYKINYYVTNPNNKKVTKVTSKVIVKDTKKPKLTGVSSTKKVEYNGVLNLSSGVSSKLVSGKNMTSKIVIKIKAPGSSKYKTLKATGNETVNYKKYQFKKVGTYRVEYAVTNPYNKKAVMKKSTVITVQDTKAPVFSGVTASRKVEFNSQVNVFSGVTAKLVSKTTVNGITATILRPDKRTENVSTTNYLFNQVGTYTVTYTAVNPTSKKAVTARASIIVEDTKEPIITIDENKLKDIKTGVPYNLYNVVKANLVSGKAINKIDVAITRKDNGNVPVIDANGIVTFIEAGNYTITYTAKNEGSGATATIKYELMVTIPDTINGTDSSNTQNDIDKTDGADTADTSVEGEVTEPADIPEEKEEPSEVDELVNDEKENIETGNDTKAEDTEDNEPNTDDGSQQQIPE